MSRPDEQHLENTLQSAFLRGEFERLHRFAWWCAQGTVGNNLPASWRDALDLVHARAFNEMPWQEFTRRRDALLDALPVAATCIGLKHGVPSAATLLAITGALAEGALSAARAASRNQRLYAELKARSVDSPSGPTPVVVDLQRAERVGQPRILRGAAAAAVSDCMARQLHTWSTQRPAR